MNVELFDKICRLCLIQSNELKSLFAKTDGDDRSLLEILAFTANIDVKIEDGLPKQVCKDCESILCKADAFIRRCHESETILHNVYLTTNTITEISTKCLQNYSIKNEKTDLKEKLSVYGTLLSPIPSNSASHYDLNKKSIEFPLCTATGLSPNKFTPEFSDKEQHIVKKETSSSNDEENQYLDHFDNGDHFDNPFDSPEKNLEVKKVKKKIGIRYECYCHTQFSNKEDYKSHLKEKKCDALKIEKSNKSKHKIPCTKCEKKFTSFNGWKYHQNTHREDSPINQNTDSNIDANLNNKTESFQCSFCLRQFKNKVSLSAHIQKHEETDSIKHVCEICKREFKYKAYLENHLLTAHSRTNGFTCDICMQSFLNKEALQTHKKSHESEKKHCCSVCNKTFQMLCSLKEHMRTHTGEKPFLCSQCGKGFSQKTNLAQHMRRHQGLKPFKCESCEKR